MLYISYYRLHVTLYRLNVTCYMLQVTSCILQVTCYMLHVAGYKLYIASYMLQVTGYTLHVTKCTLSVVCCMIYVKCIRTIFEFIAIAINCDLVVEGQYLQRSGSGIMRVSCQRLLLCIYFEWIISFNKSISTGKIRLSILLISLENVLLLG